MIAFDSLQVEVADGFLSRFVGLLGRRGLDKDRALLLTPCNNVHTAFMRFPIDVVFLDRDGKVLSVVVALKPWRMAVAWKAHACLELAEGGAQRHDLYVGRVVASLAQRTAARAA